MDVIVEVEGNEDPVVTNYKISSILDDGKERRTDTTTTTTIAPLCHKARSYRKLHKENSRARLTRLESFIHPEHSKALQPSKVLYLSVFIALIGAFQSGWLLTQLNYLPFNTQKACDAPEIAPGTCIMFPRHSKHEWTMAVSAWIVGAACGAGLSGLPADKYGRKTTLFFNAFITIAGAIIQAIAQDIYTFAIGRLISGISSGTTINVSNVYISEISPAQMRGLFSTGIQAAVSVGSLFVTTAHYAVGTSHEIAWRLLVGFPIVLGASQLLLMPMLSQSPVWLIAQGKMEVANLALRALYRPTNFHVIFHALIAAHDEEQNEIKGINPWVALFSKKYARQVTIAITLCMAQQWSGINAIMYYSASIFSRAGVSDPRVANTIVNLIRTISIISAAKIIDKFRRRTLLCGGMATMAIASTGLVFGLIHGKSALAVASVCVYIIAYCFSIGPMAWMVSSELFPDFLRADAGSIGTMSTWISNFFVGAFYPVLAADDSLGNYAFCIFIGCLLFFVCFVVTVVPETANKTYVEIQRAFGIEDHVHDTTPEDHDPWETSCCDSANTPGLPIDE